MVTQTPEAALQLATVPQVVDRYFSGFNAEDYDRIADLFVEDGVLLAPFEEPIVGPEAICAYLKAEAGAMRATPVEVDVVVNPDGMRQVIVGGRVKTLLFSVNVRWTFVLTATDEIQSAEIKLLASLRELMQFDRS
ncbi:MAG: nuclear transport factor 2 family protein [Cyanobacteria bacterium J06638_6]